MCWRRTAWNPVTRCWPSPTMRIPLGQARRFHPLFGPGPEVGVAAKTFVCQVSRGDGRGSTGRLRPVTRSTAAQLVDELRRMPDRLAAAATGVEAHPIPPIAEEVSSSSGFVFISKGNGLPYAAEGALKRRN